MRIERSEVGSLMNATCVFFVPSKSPAATTVVPTVVTDRAFTGTIGFGVLTTTLALSAGVALGLGCGAVAVQAISATASRVIARAGLRMAASGRACS
jgi:hypothetical protein